MSRRVANGPMNSLESLWSVSVAIRTRIGRQRLKTSWYGQEISPLVTLWVGMGALPDLVGFETRNQLADTRKCHSHVTILWSRDLRAQRIDRKSLYRGSQTTQTVRKKLFLWSSEEFCLPFWHIDHWRFVHETIRSVTILWNWDLRVEQLDQKNIYGWSQTIQTLRKK